MLNQVGKDFLRMLCCNECLDIPKRSFVDRHFGMVSVPDPLLEKLSKNCPMEYLWNGALSLLNRKGTTAFILKQTNGLIGTLTVGQNLTSKNDGHFI